MLKNILMSVLVLASVLVQSADYPEMVLIPSGTFMMGAKPGEGMTTAEYPQHEVSINSFYIGRYEVTNTQFVEFLNDVDEVNGLWLYDRDEDWDSVIYLDDDGIWKLTQVNGFGDVYADVPVFNVSWHGAVAYCEWLSEKTGDEYRLPSEAEWEYACRAGSTERFFWHSYWYDSDYLWCLYNSNDYAHPVGGKEPNDWGLYDMSGNVKEFCQDNFLSNAYSNLSSYSTNDSGNPVYLIEDTGDYDKYVFRGGSYSNNEWQFSSTYRYWQQEYSCWDDLGFRVARTIVEPTITLSTSSISASGQEGGSVTNKNFYVRNSGVGTLNYTITDNRTWMYCSPTSGTSTGENDPITVYFNTSGLSAGTYTGTISVSDSNATNSPRTISVTLTVSTTPPTISLSTSSITNSCTEGSNASSQSFTINNSGGGTLSYSVSESLSWLSCTPISGTATTETDTITINYSSSGLGLGTYTGTISVSDGNATNSPQTIAVSLTVTGTVVDTQAPSIPTNFRGFFANTNDIKLYWDASTDNVGVRYYAIYRGEDNSLVGTTSDTNMLVTGTSHSTMHRYKIKAFDFSGNASAFGSEAVVMPEGYDTEDPSIPQNCVGAGISDTAVRLAWDASTDDIGVRFYAIYRSEDNSLVGTTPYTSYVVRGLEQYVTYKYKIKAFDYADNRSSFGNEVQVRTLVPDDEAPSIPQNLIAMGSSSSEVVLRWESSMDNEGVRFYAVYRYEDSVLLGTSYTNEFTLGGLAENTDYIFRIKAFDFNSNRSSFSNTATTQTLKPGTSAPTAPSNLTGEALSDSQIQLTWDPSTDDQGVRMYAVYMGASNTLVGTTWQTEYIVEGLSSNTEYTFKLKAFDWNGNRSGFSNEIAIETLLNIPEGFVFIPSGFFEMGSENGNFDVQPIHTVSINEFLMSQYEVTFAQYIEFLNSVENVQENWVLDNQQMAFSYIINNNGVYSVDPEHVNLPVFSVSWYGAKAYCEWLTENNPGIFYLPSEAEWEYACRAGSTTKYYWGDNMNGSYCWYEGNSGSISSCQNIGRKLPNAWGLYDMSGNIREWCSDWYYWYSYEENLDSSNYIDNPSGNPVYNYNYDSRFLKAARGGDAYSDQDACTSSNRFYNKPDNTWEYSYGFRVARTVNE